MAVTDISPLDRLEHTMLPRASVGGGATPLLSDTFTAVAQGARDVAEGMQDAAAAKRGAR